LIVCSSTTGIAANLLNRNFLGIDQEVEFLEISKQRKREIENIRVFNDYKQKIQGFKDKKQLTEYLLFESPIEYGQSLAFDE